jgi:hypothetical protein
MAVTNPVALTEASAGVSDVQVPPAVASESCTVPFTQVVAAPEMAATTGFGFTVKFVALVPVP